MKNIYRHDPLLTLRHLYLSFLIFTWEVLSGLVRFILFKLTKRVDPKTIEICSVWTQNEWWQNVLLIFKVCWIRCEHECVWVCLTNDSEVSLNTDIYNVYLCHLSCGYFLPSETQASQPLHYCLITACVQQPITSLTAPGHAPWAIKNDASSTRVISSPSTDSLNLIWHKLSAVQSNISQKHKTFT